MSRLPTLLLLVLLGSAAQAAAGAASGDRLPYAPGDAEGVLPAGTSALPPPAPARTSPFLQSLVDRVSPDSIRGFLSRLTGEEPVPFAWGSRSILTRYSITSGADNAAQMLASRLRGYGYDVALRYFRMEQTLAGLRFDPSGTGLAVASGGWILRAEPPADWTRVRQGCDLNEQPLHGIDRIASVAVAVGDAGTILTSNDNGLSWTGRWSGTTLPLHGAGLEPGGTGWAVGEAGTCLRTTNSGLAWTRQTSGQTSVLYDVAALDANDGIAVGGQGMILRTSNAGQTWTPIPSGSSSALRAVAFVGSSGWAVGDAGTICATTDGGLSWTQQASPAPVTLNAVSFSDALRGWVAGSNGKILRTTDGGAGWALQTNPLPGASFYSVCAVSSLEGWVGGNYGHLLRTSDGGATWELRDGTVEAGWANVEATSTGTTEPGQEVLLTGHYDSTSEMPLVRAPGADDNGSGTAMVVEAARVLAGQRFGRTVRFLCFSGEEEGLYGSSAYALNARQEGRDLYAVVNFDCVGWSDLYLRIVSNDASVWLGDLATSVGASYEPELPIQHILCPSCGWSDHGPFWDQGFDAICGIESWEPSPPQIHTSGDTLGLLNLPLLGRVAGLSVATVATLAGIDTTAAGVASPIPEPGTQGIARSEALLLEPPRPNPFASRTVLHASVPEGLPYQMRIYAPSGRLVRTLRRGRGSGGVLSFTWDALDDRGRLVPAGVYLLRLDGESVSVSRRVTVIR